MTDDPIKAALKLQPTYNPDWLAKTKEDIIDPAREIVDPHHHVWDRAGNRFLFDDVLAEFGSGHNVIASVHAPCHSMYRVDGPEEMRPVGETEFINGVAAQSASGQYGPTRICAGIVAMGDLMLGAGIEPVLEAHIRAGGGRLRGIRPSVAWHESTHIRVGEVKPRILVHREARDALRVIAKLGLTLDLWVFFTQLDEVLDVCREIPELTVVVDHLGGPLGIGPYAGKRDEVFKSWRAGIEAVATCSNAVIKLGGLAMRYAGFDYHHLPRPPSSDLLADNWRPYIETCIEKFGADRSMFESNFPVDRGMCSYPVLWNTFKKLSASASPKEKDALFRDTAARLYKLDLRQAKTPQRSNL